MAMVTAEDEKENRLTAGNMKPAKFHINIMELVFELHGKETDDEQPMEPTESYPLPGLESQHKKAWKQRLIHKVFISQTATKIAVKQIPEGVPESQAVLFILDRET
jgi:hypothetical protein